jgi:hypothetical protein
MNMSQLQKVSGITMPTVRRYWYNTGDGRSESDKPLQEVNFNALEAIARVLGVRPVELLDDGGEGGSSGNSVPVLLAA